MGLCSLIANRGKSFDRFLDELAQKEITKLTLQFRGSVPKQHTYRVRNIAYADSQRYAHQLRIAHFTVGENRLVQPSGMLCPELQVIVDAYVNDVRYARQKGFEVKPVIDPLARCNPQYVTMGMSMDFPVIKETIEKRIS